MEFVTPNKEAFVRLVQKCLKDNSDGYVERDQFIEFCSELSVSTDELDSVFNELDNDGDGRVNVSDFTTSFDQVTKSKSDNLNEEASVNLADSVNRSLYEFQGNSLESPMQSISSTGQQYISALYDNLTNSNQPGLLDLFEKHLVSVVKDIKAKAAENQRLEEALKRASQQHARQVNNLDREVEQQMEKLEAKVRQEEKSLYDKKLSDFEWQLEGKDKEISAMNKTIETLQSRLDKETNKPNFRREELENVDQENRYLKSQVTDSQTAVALLRSELAELKSQFVELSGQLEKEQRTAQASVHEQENLARQLQLLYEANQRLQDINDELRGSLENRKCSSPERRKSCEVLKLSGNLELSPRKRSSTHPRNVTPPLVSSLNEYHGHDYNDNTLNEDSLFAEIHRASTPYKSDSVDEEDDEAYGTMSNSRKAEVQRQIQILEDTNKRLSSSNDELRVALKLMARSGSFRKPKKTSGNRKNQNSHSDYGSLSSNRSSRSLSPKHKRLSNGDIGEATDESTTYDVEEEEIVGTIAEETLKDLILKYSESKLAGDKDRHDHDIKNTKNVEDDNQCENAKEFHEMTEQESQNFASRDVTGDRMMYENCLDNAKPLSHRNVEFADGKPSNDKRIRTRSKSLEIFYIENFANLESDVDSNDGIDGDVGNDGLNRRTSHESSSMGLIQNSDLKDSNNYHNSYNDSSDDDNHSDNSIINNYSIKNSRNDNSVTNNNHNSNNNNTKGLWEITRALNAYDSQSSLDELSCIEEEGSLEEESSEQLESKSEEIIKTEEMKDQKWDEQNNNLNQHQRKKYEDINRKKNKKIESENGFVEEESSDNELVNDQGFEKEQFVKNDPFGRGLNRQISEGKSVAQKQNQKSLSNSRSSEGLENKLTDSTPVKQKFKEDEAANGLQNDETKEQERNGDEKNGLESSEEEVSDLEGSDWETDEKDDTKDNKEMETQGVWENDRRNKKGYFNDSREYNGDEDDSDEEEIEKRAELKKSWRSDRKNDMLSNDDNFSDDNDDNDSSYEEDSEYSSDEEMSDSSVERRQDSTATMNSETIADLEHQFNKIKNSKEGGEGKSSKSDVDDDEDDDNDEMDSAELAELVAMASDLTDVTDSDSEIGKSGSTKMEEISTITTATNESLAASFCTPERMYKLVLAGDAAVGKSSFILRLCKNKFHSSLNATLGVDFQVKNLKVDSKTVALQLWDTAGQERFRSIAKSYFRKVDGVLLLYDVTCESSFVNIRDWMSTIEESSQKKVPIMLCGNKCDLRDEYIREGRKVVSTESGQRLAKHYDALFIETSAKDGSHIEDACKELARILTSLENEEIQQSGLKLDKKDREKKKRPCCPS